MQTDKIRTAFLEFFRSKGHQIVPSDSLVPANDPTLLFTGAGMNQFKENFLGLKKDLSRATSSQKCLRTGDLDEVGRTAYHHSFFEMLGNFSFGDYFKTEAIEWAWEFLTRVVHIDPKKLRISVHKTDDEAYRIWKDHIGVQLSFIESLGDKSNFWPSNAPADGPNGPCGPCSEIYYDTGNPNTPGSIEGNPERFAEIWNLVFTQFDRQDGGKLPPLKHKNIDTGMGLERLACVLQGKTTNFEIDSFEPINRSVCEKLKIQAAKAEKRHLYAISDHIRAVTFLLGDGVFPTNDGRGYIVRKLIRRALWHGLCLVKNRSLSEPFLHGIIPAVIQTAKAAYPELMSAEQSIASTVKSEEGRFLATLDSGLRILEQRFDQISGESKIVPGELAFELYDTYGFPTELTRDVAEERGFKIDESGFQKQMELQRERAKKSSRISNSIFVASELDLTVKRLEPTKFLGYETLTSSAKVIHAEIKGSQGIVILDQTPFYAESGGQAGDIGVLKNNGFSAQVTDTQKIDQCFVHHVEIKEGSIKVGDTLAAEVDCKNRRKIMRNHTATHLLHSALRQTLGVHVRQLGSLVTAQKLRFDYSHPAPLTDEQISKVEELVNQQILANLDVGKEEKPVETAKKEGAIAFFGEKYGQLVRVVSVADFSKELCGGTHCCRTGDIGSFVITQETSVASGTRRIEALTGDGALNHYAWLRSQLEDLSVMLKTNPKDIRVRVGKLLESAKKSEKGQPPADIQRFFDAKVLEQAIQKIGAHQWIGWYESGLDLQTLRKISDKIRSACQKTVYLIAGTMDDRNYYIFGVSGDMKDSALDLRPIWDNARGGLSASGGGRKDLIQGGGEKLVLKDSHFEEIKSLVIKNLG